MSFINDNFLLKNETAKTLYNNFAKDMPIIDYHCHISPKMIAEDYKFKNAYDLTDRQEQMLRVMMENMVPIIVDYVKK